MTPEQKTILQALGLDKILEQRQAPEGVQSAIERAEEAARKAEAARKRAEQEAEKAKEKALGIPRKIEIYIPERKPIKPGDFVHEKYETLLRMIALGQNILMVGPAGSGKTYAAETGAVDCGYIPFKQQAPHDPFDMTGYNVPAKDGGSEYQETPLYRWATCAEKACYILDEIDASNPRALMPCSPALANGWAVFPNGEIKIPEGHIAIGTANTWLTGSGIGEYVGACKHDARILSRFPARIFWDYDVRLEKHICQKRGGDVDAWEKCLDIRKNLAESGIRIVWGPRETVGVAQRVASGMSLADALETSALISLESDQYDRATQGVL